MSRSMFRSVLTVTLALAAFLATVGGASVTHGAALQQGTPPVGLNASHSTVSGRLVAKPITSTGPRVPVICGERDRSPDVHALMANRGLVICTPEGELVLLQLSPNTGIYDRLWDRIGINRLALGDHINAWGILRAGKSVLNPTYAVQDTSIPRGQEFQIVTGRLVAKPVTGEGPRGQVICGDRDRTPDVRAMMVNRGLVVCTEEGKLVLLQLSATTKIWTRDRAAIRVLDLSIGDRISARGRLQAGGFVLNPTLYVKDLDLQAKATASQDFIANAGRSLTLYVLQSDAGGPVQGVVTAQQRDRSRVILCSGATGSWANLRPGLTIDISQSIFNLRTRSYVDTEIVRIVSCA